MIKLSSADWLPHAPFPSCPSSRSKSGVVSYCPRAISRIVRVNQGAQQPSQRLRITAVGFYTIIRPTRHRGRRDRDAVNPVIFQETIDHEPARAGLVTELQRRTVLADARQRLVKQPAVIDDYPEEPDLPTAPSSATAIDIASRWTSRPMNFVEMVIVSSFRYTILNAQHPEIPSLGASSHHQGTVIGSITRLKAGSAFCTRPQKSTGKFLVVGPDSQSISEFWQRLRSRTQRQHPRLDKGLFRRGCHLVLDRVWAKYQPGHA